MTLHDCIADYLRFLRYEQGAAPTTIKAYQARLHNFQNWLTENGYPDATLDAFNVPTLRRFLYHLGGKGLRPRTIRGFFNPIRSLGAFLVANEALTENPAVKVGLPKKDAAQRETVSEEEIRQLLDACERRRNPQQIALARALFSVLIFAGVRRSECLDLKLDDVNLSDGSLLVRNGKGNKSRRVFLCADACSALREWLALRPKDCTHSYIFAFDRNRRIHHDGLRTLLEEIKAIAGLAGHENIKPQSLRHPPQPDSFAMEPIFARSSLFSDTPTYKLPPFTCTVTRNVCAIFANSLPCQSHSHNQMTAKSCDCPNAPNNGRNAPD